jgi:arginase
MREILVAPWHLEERLDGFPVPDGAVVIDALTEPDRVTLLREQCRLVSAAVAQGTRPLLLAGDCLSALGLVAGLQERHRDLAVIWFDAHGDFNTPAISQSGYLAGMALAMLTGHATQPFSEPLGVRPIEEQHVVLIGARDLDPAESHALDASAVTCTGVDRAEVASAIDGLGAAPVYLHIDLDVIDGAELPQLRFPTPSRPSWPELEACLELIAARADVVAVCIAGTFPRETVGSSAAQAAIRGVAAQLGVELAFATSAASVNPSFEPEREA